MRRRSVWLILAPVLLGFGITGVVLVEHAGTTAGTPSDTSSPIVKACPSGPPDACHDLMAQLLRVDMADLPSMAVATPGLRFQKGYLLISRVGEEPNGVFVYASADGQTVFHLLVFPRAAPKQDGRPVGTTSNHRTFRIVRTALGTIGLVFNDEHLGYILKRGIGGDLNQSPHTFRLAEQVVDAVHLRTRQLNP